MLGNILEAVVVDQSSQVKSGLDPWIVSARNLGATKFEITFCIRHLSLHLRCQIKKGQLLIPYFVHPRFGCQTIKNPKILFSLHGAARTSRMTWRNLFGHWSTQSAFLSQNAPSQPWVDWRSNKVIIPSKYHFSWFYIKPELLWDFWPFWPSLARSWL